MDALNSSRRELKVSVVVMTFNHEEFLSAALDSVISQDELPDEILVSDDASSDRTVEIAEEYRDKYPELIRIIVNEHNLGIYRHLDAINERLRGDVICFLPGDDLFEPNSIRNLRQELLRHNLKKEEAFIVVANHNILYKNGKKVVFDNSSVSNMSPVSMRLRGDLSTRRYGVSKVVYDRMPELDPIFQRHRHLGYSFDTLKGFIEFSVVDKFVFADFFATAYRVGVGVTSLDSNHCVKQHLAMFTLLREEYGELFCLDDLKYIEFRESICKAHIGGKFTDYLRSLIFLVKNINNFSPNRGVIFHASLLLRREGWVSRLLRKIIRFIRSV